MTRRTKAAVPAPLGPQAVLKWYRRWLARQPLAERSRDAYLAQVTGFVTWLGSSGDRAQALTDPRGARPRRARLQAPPQDEEEVGADAR